MHQYVAFIITMAKAIKKKYASQALNIYGANKHIVKPNKSKLTMEKKSCQEKQAKQLLN